MAFTLSAIDSLQFGCENSGKMQVTSASTRTVFRDMGCGHGEGVDGSPPVVRPKKIANVDRLLRGGAIYNCSGNLGPLFMPALVYSFSPGDDRCMWIRTIASCVCSSIFVGGVTTSST
mmetsp:Transcript_57031/g.135980  ORF Transcript_57031/g.135980 Transcript_57031/m.135980 type:complete len:118 (+) Transcript_57031:85-438(+)